MNNDKLEELVKTLTSIIKGEIEDNEINEKIGLNYTDENGNGWFHILTNYSFEEYCLKNFQLDKDKEKINVKKFDEIKNEYKSNMLIYINILLNLKCNLLSENNPLLLSIQKKNYIITKEYFIIQQNLNHFSNEQCNNILNSIINNGNCFDKDCIELISNVLCAVNSKDKTNIFNKYLLNKENKEYELTPLIALCRNFSENIYDRYNQIVKIKSIEYINKDNNKSLKPNPLDQKSLDDIKKKSVEELNNYLNNYFYPLLIKFIELGANINYYENKYKSNQTSGFMYLMKYPFIQDLLEFIKKYNININYQDFSCNTALTYLIKNKSRIAGISNNIYERTFSLLIKNDYIQIENNDNIETSPFFLSLIKGNFIDAKSIYTLFKDIYLLNFHFFIVIFIINIFNFQQKRSLLHCIFLYLNDEKAINFVLYKELLSLLQEYKIDVKIKDQFNRNSLFYFFLSENDNPKITDPFEKLEYCLSNFQIDMNEVDIFGHNLLFYAIQSKANLCIN